MRVILQKTMLKVHANSVDVNIGYHYAACDFLTYHMLIYTGYNTVIWNRVEKD